MARAKTCYDGVVPHSALLCQRGKRSNTYELVVSWSLALLLVLARWPRHASVRFIEFRLPCWRGLEPQRRR